MRLLITGGAGYIGSHVCARLLEAGHDVVVIDNFSNSDRDNLSRVMEVSGRELTWIEADVRDRLRIRETLSQDDFDAILHFAALKSAPDSIRHPERHHDVNVGGTTILLEETLRAGVDKFVFCSSAAVYGVQHSARARETDNPCPTTPYARTKVAGEQLLRNAAHTRVEFKTCSLRCFNPIGAHPSGLLGYHFTHQPEDLLSRVLAARHHRRAIDIYGTDHDTSDRSAVRDFVHVVDIADGCMAALAFLADGVDRNSNQWTFNLGTGRPCSVLELIGAMEKVGEMPILKRERPRRAGDISISVADPTSSAATLKWQAWRSLEEACADALTAFDISLSR